MILLTDDELDELTDVEKYNCEAIPMTRDICKAQAKKVLDFLIHRCNEKTHSGRHLIRFNCQECCAEIEKELE